MSEPTSAQLFMMFNLGACSELSNFAMSGYVDGIDRSGPNYISTVVKNHDRTIDSIFISICQMTEPFNYMTKISVLLRDEELRGYPFRRPNGDYIGQYFRGRESDIFGL